MHYKTIREVLDEFGIEEFNKIDRTVYSCEDRGKEILLYCTEHNINVENILVIDDDVSDILGHIPQEKVLKTSWKDGLTYDLVYNITKNMVYRFDFISSL